MGDPTVSLVVQTYNHERFIEEGLASLLAQDTTEPFEILVVDDCSTDGTWDAIQRVGDERVRSYRTEHNLGAVGAFNDAFGRTRGEFVARLDGDDRWRPQFVSSVLGALRTHPRAPLAYANIAVIDAEGALKEERPAWAGPLPSDREQQMIELLTRYCVPAPTIIARRSAWESAVPVPPAYQNHVDWPFSVRMAMVGRPFAYVDDVVADYRLHGGNETMRPFTDRRRERTVLAVLDEVFSSLPADMWPEPPLDAWPALHAVRDSVYALAYRNCAASYNCRGMRRHAAGCLAWSAVLSPRELAVTARVGASVLRGVLDDGRRAPAGRPTGPPATGQRRCVPCRRIPG